jgi:hypothetical protein
VIVTDTHFFDLALFIGQPAFSWFASVILGNVELIPQLIQDPFTQNLIQFVILRHIL